MDDKDIARAKAEAKAEAERLSVQKLDEQIAAESHLLHEIFSQAGEDFDASAVTAIKLDDGQNLADEVQKRNYRLEGLKSVADAKREMKRLAEQAAKDDAEWNKPVSRPGMPAAAKKDEPRTLGDAFVNSKGYKDMVDGEGHITHRKGAMVDIAIPAHRVFNLKDEYEEIVRKTVMSTGAGWAPEPVRTGDVAMAAGAGQPTTTLDFLPSRTVNTADVRFMRQTTRTSAAVEIAESSDGSLQSAPEAAQAFTEVTEPIRKINHFLPVSDEQFEDVAQLRAVINNDLSLMVRQRLNLQVLVGNGTAPNIEGFLDGDRATNTTAKGTDNVPDAIHKAMTENRVTGRAEPDAVILHPNDWEGIRLLTTTDGIYVFGPPSQSGATTIWGIPVIVDSDITENTGLLGGFRQYSYVAIRRNVSVQASSEHASFFIQGVIALLAEMRAGLVVLREDAFSTITGI